MSNDTRTDPEWTVARAMIQELADEGRAAIFPHEPILSQLAAAREADPARYRREWLSRLSDLELPKVHTSSLSQLTKIARLYPPNGRVAHLVKTTKFELTVESAKALAKKRALRLVEDLQVTCRMQTGAYGALLSSAHLVNLRKVEAIKLAVGDAALVALQRNEAACGVRELLLHGNDITDDGLAAIVASDTSKIEVLDLSFNDLAKDALRGLNDGAVLAGVRVLELGGNAIGAEAVARIAATTQLKDLRTLGVKYTDVDAPTLLPLLDTHRFPALEEIRLDESVVDLELRAAATRTGVRLYTN